MRRLGLLLCLVLSARAGDEPRLHVFDVADLKSDDTWYAVAMAKAKAAAQGADVRAAGNTIVVNGNAAVQEKVAKELKTVRDAFGQLVRMEVRFVRAENGLGVASVSAQKLDALLKERRAETLAGPSMVCRNGQKASLSALREISFVGDFTLATDNQGNVTADPVVETLHDGISANLRPLVAGGKVRIAAEFTLSEVAGQMPEVELPMPLPAPVRIQVPEGTTRTVRKLLECAPGDWAVVDLGGGHVVLIEAEGLRAEETGGFGGEEPKPGDAGGPPPEEK